MNWLADKIEQWPTAKLIPYARNARTHSEDQVAQIAASIAEFGFTNPILAGSDGVIVAGHGRLAAAQKLGLELVPVVVLDHLTPIQRRALVIADNRIAENAGWDWDVLRVELDALQLEGFDLDITGFDADALADLIAGDEPDFDDQTDEAAVPEVTEKPISRPGDVWIMGQHRLLCGDATVAESYDRLMQGNAADMVFTDPPYNVNYANSAKDKMRGKDRAILNDNLGAGFYDFLLAALTPTVAHCRGAIYVAMSSSELDALQSAFRAAGGHWSTFIIWAKNTFTLGRADYQRQYEPILYGWRTDGRHSFFGGRKQGTVLEDLPIVIQEQEDHALICVTVGLEQVVIRARDVEVVSRADDSIMTAWRFEKPIRNGEHPTMKPIAPFRTAAARAISYLTDSEGADQRSSPPSRRGAGVFQWSAIPSTPMSLFGGGRSSRDKGQSGSRTE